MTKQTDCCPPKLTKDQKTDVLVRLEHIHEKMHAGKAYGFEQTLLCDAVREIKVLRSAFERLLDYGERMAHGNVIHQDTWQQHADYCRQLLSSDRPVKP